MHRFPLARTLFPVALALAACVDPTSSSTTAATDHALAMSPRLWLGGAARPGADPVATAVAHVAGLARAWSGAAGTADLAPIATVPVAAGAVVRLAQTLDGIPVDGGEVRVLVGVDGAAVAASGDLIDPALPRASAIQLDAAAALAVALDATLGRPVATVPTAAPGRSARAAGAWFTGGAAAPGQPTLSQARVQQVWARAGLGLEAAWVVEAFTSADGTATTSEAYRTVVSAVDGRVLARRNLTADAAFQYRVWADPAGDQRPGDGPVADFTPHPSGAPTGVRPPFVPPTLVSVDGRNTNPGGTFDPWLPAGATESNGNNVDAYVDVNPPDGLSAGDFRAAVTGPGAFDRTYDVTAEPLSSTAQQMAAVTGLFYTINWLHDDWYDSGFTEAAGNAQADNYGRGGVDGDVLHAEAQDNALGGSRNNANMSTPGDGLSPRMQMFLWSAGSDSSLTLTPGGTPATRGAAFGPGNFDLTGQVVAGTDGTGTPTDGCQPLTNQVAGKIVLLDRGACSFESKVANGQQAGALGVLLANNTGTSPMNMPDDADTTGVTIPVLSVSQAAGAALRASLTAGAVTAALHRTIGAETDADLDALVVAHEFGHYVHHRLSLCGTAMCGAMSEGWGDFIALHFTARAGDDLAGTFGLSNYAAANSDPYFGIRRFPYTVDPARNGLTFGDMADSATLPDQPRNDNGGPNSEVHNAGEVWATMLWEAYVALHQANPGVPFDEVRRRMGQYVVTGLLLAPPDATVTEMRDALLVAARATSAEDQATLAAAFARRGAGSCAESPPRDSDTFEGIVESYQVQGNAVIVAPTLVLTEDCDGDGVLDVGDRGTLTVPVDNVGAVGLTGLTVSATSTTPGLTITGGPIAVASLDAAASTTATFAVSLDSGGGDAIAGEVVLAVDAAGSCVDHRTVTLPMRLNVDDVPAASATDHFDAVPSAWSRDGGGADHVWTQETQSALDRAWHGRDVGTGSDTSLVSPPLKAGSGAVTIAFDHRFEFEASLQAGGLVNFDGGVIELTTDGGATWADISTVAAPGYTGTITDQSDNPLPGRDAYVANNPSAPGTDHVTLDLGTRLSGKTFQLRFRIVTDGGVGALGWIIDDVVTTGLGKPFPEQVGDAQCDGAPGAGGDAGGCCSAGSTRGRDGGAAALLGLGVLAAVTGRRRRRR